MGDNTEYFIELFYKDGACQDTHTQGLMDYNHNH